MPWRYDAFSRSKSHADIDTKQCCAIDYILHTLDSATSLLNSPRNFPSRLSIPAPSHRHFSSLARRLGRIFAHAYFHHRAAFAQAEAESALYARFLALTSRFELVPAEFLVIPPGIVGYEEHDGPDEYPRSMLGAALDPHRERERGREDEPRGILHVDALGEPLPGSDERREPSPRKMGRSRTDTMVHSEMASVVEELGRAAAVEGETEESRERVPTVRPDDVQKREQEEMTTAQEPPEAQPVVDLEPATEPEAPAAPLEPEPESVVEEPQTEYSDVSEHVEVGPLLMVACLLLSVPSGRSRSHSGRSCATSGRARSRRGSGHRCRTNPSGCSH